MEIEDFVSCRINEVELILSFNLVYISTNKRIRISIDTSSPANLRRQRVPPPFNVPRKNDLSLASPRRLRRMCLAGIPSSWSELTLAHSSSDFRGSPRVFSKPFFE